MDDIPDMSTPSRAPNRKRPALAFDSPKKPSKRPFIEEGGRPVSDRDSSRGSERDRAVEGPIGQGKGPADGSPVAGTAPSSHADDAGPLKPLSVSTPRAPDGKDKAPEVNDQQEETPRQATFDFSTMQSQHLKAELDELDDTVFEASRTLCQSPCNTDTLTLQSPSNAEASFVTATSTLGTGLASSPTPVFKVRPSMGKFLPQARLKAGTTASPFDPEKFRLLPPRWHKDVDIDFDEEMDEPPVAGTPPGAKSPDKSPQKSPDKIHRDHRWMQIPDTEEREASADKYAVQASAAPLVPASSVRGPARIPPPAQPPKARAVPAEPSRHQMIKVAASGPTVVYDKTGAAQFPTRAVMTARVRALYTGMPDNVTKRFPKDKPRLDQLHRLQNLVFNHRIALERLPLAAGSPPLSIEHHSEFAKDVFAKVTAWQRARDEGCQESQLPPLPLHVEILAGKLLSNNNKHHDSVLKSLTGTPYEYLLEPIPSAYDSYTLAPVPSTTLRQPPPPNTPPPPPPASAPPSMRQMAPQLSTHARNKIACLRIVAKPEHKEERVTLSNMISQVQAQVQAKVQAQIQAKVQENAVKQPGQLLMDTLHLIRQQQNSINETMKALKKSLSDVEKLQAKQISAVSTVVSLSKRLQLHPARMANIADDASMDHGFQEQASPAPPVEIRASSTTPADQRPSSGADTDRCSGILGYDR